MLRQAAHGTVDQSSGAGQSHFDVGTETPERDQTLELARTIWHTHYGSPIQIERRTSFTTTSSGSLGGPGDGSAAPLTEAAWVRQRRTAVTAWTAADATAPDPTTMADIAVAAA